MQTPWNVPTTNHGITPKSKTPTVGQKPIIVQGEQTQEVEMGQHSNVYLFPIKFGHSKIMDSFGEPVHCGHLLLLKHL